MKTVSVFSLTSLGGTLAFATGLMLNLAPLPLFAGATATLVLLTWAGDYRPRRDLAVGTTIALPPAHPLPLAA